MKRLALLIAVVGLAAAACAEPIGAGGPITTRPAAGGGTAAVTTATSTPSGGDPSAATTTTAAPASTTSTTAAAGTMGVKAYFMLADGGTGFRPGPFLAPVYREVPRTEQVAAAALRALLAGPTADERASVPALSSAVPGDTVLLGIGIADGRATVNLSREFEAGGGTFSMTARLAQVVFTLTQFPTVREVEFRLDGVAVTVFSSEGIMLDRPVSREDYRDLIPLIFVDDPAYGAPVGNPVRVRGVAAVFEAQFNYVLADWDGRIIADGFAMTDNGAGWGAFEFSVPYDVEGDQLGALIVFDYSAEDGSQQNVREHPIWLRP